MIRQARKKILILYCGKELNYENFCAWIKEMPELEIIAEIAFLFLKNDDGCDKNYFWEQLSQEIRKQKKFDGFVVIHPLSGLLFVSCALSFLLNDFKPPVIFTADYDRPDGEKNKFSIKANLINSVQAATMDFSEVALMFGNRLLRANQAARNYVSSLSLFIGPEKSVLGKIDFSIRILKKNLKNIKAPARFKSRLNDRIEYVKVLPFFNFDNLRKLKEKDGLFLDGTGQILSAKNSDFLKKLDLPVLLFNFQDIESGRNLIAANYLTMEAALTKFMFVLAQTKKISEINQLMAANIAGELL
ncbi:hypothetical protein C4569_02920 [Candidatus Parcubacteria bacterium]|nr:MAG: hypothetical protein C4569_02920 [Candidatus Parcubacteria bacterium]